MSTTNSEKKSAPVAAENEANRMLPESYVKFFVQIEQMPNGPNNHMLAYTFGIVNQSIERTATVSVEYIYLHAAHQVPPNTIYQRDLNLTNIFGNPIVLAPGEEKTAYRSYGTGDPFDGYYWEAAYELEGIRYEQWRI